MNTERQSLGADFRRNPQPVPEDQKHKATKHGKPKPKCGTCGKPVTTRKAKLCAPCYQAAHWAKPGQTKRRVNCDGCGKRYESAKREGPFHCFKCLRGKPMYERFKVAA